MGVRRHFQAFECPQGLRPCPNFAFARGHSTEAAHGVNSHWLTFGQTDALDYLNWRWRHSARPISTTGAPTPIHRLVEHRRLTSVEASAALKVPMSELPDLLQGRLATCSLDQLLRMLTWLGDDVEILIRPRLQRTKRGAIRVLQTAAVEKPDDFEPVRHARGKGLLPTGTAAGSESSDQEAVIGRAPKPDTRRDDRQLLDKHAVEKMTSLDITTIYRKMSAGTFPQPVKVGRRRVAWRTSHIVQWRRQELEVGTETARWKANRARGGDAGARGGGPPERR